MKYWVLVFGVLVGIQGFAKSKKTDKKADDKAAVAEAKEPRVYFVEPTDNAVLQGKFKIKMGVDGMKVCEANKKTQDKACGHFHILIDQAAFPEGQAIPKDEWHLHFGKKETATELTLAPGKHLLTLQYADFAHLSMGAKFSHTITVEVK